YRDRFIWALTVIPAILFLVFQSPVKMVVAGGVAQALMIPVIAAGALYLRHKRLPGEIRPPWYTTVALWIASAVIICLMGYYALLTAGL
ncbi:MAG: hypothetical protein K6T59_11845, partial [Bryobacteraceae bacterium]|nr:hypothetical protein [Bryobacteraceae bacterium]